MSRRRLMTLLRLALVALALFGLSRLIDASDIVRAKQLIQQVGWPLALVMLPTLIAMMLDAQGWRLVLATLGHVVPGRHMLELRLSVEAIVLAMPGGSVAGEAAKVALLARRTGVPAAVGAASLAIIKLLLIAGDSLYLAVAAFWVTVVIRVPSTLPGWLAAGGAAFTALIAWLLALLLRRASLGARLGRSLARLPIARLRRWIDAKQADFQSLDDAAKGFFDARLSTQARCFVPFMLEWLIEGLETLLILRCLGVPLGLGEALAVDGVGSLLRVLVFFIPAGLGVQDAAQIMLLGTLGVNDPMATGAAFVFIKRTKEILWIVIGLSFLAVRRDLWRR